MSSSQADSGEPRLKLSTDKECSRRNTNDNLDNWKSTVGKCRDIGKHIHLAPNLPAGSHDWRGRLGVRPDHESQSQRYFCRSLLCPSTNFLWLLFPVGWLVWYCTNPASRDYSTPTTLATAFPSSVREPPKQPEVPRKGQ